MLLAFYMCPDGIQIANKILEYESKPMIFSDFLNVSADLKGPKVKYNLNYGLCTPPGYFLGLTHGTNASCSDNK